MQLKNPFRTVALLLIGSLFAFLASGRSRQAAENYEFRNTVVASGEGLPKGTAAFLIRISVEREPDGQISGAIADLRAELKFETAVSVRSIQLKSGGAALEFVIRDGTPLVLWDGKGVVARSVKISRADRSALQVIRGMESDPKSLILLIQISETDAGTLRSPVLPAISYVPYLAQGEKRVSVIYLTNPSASSEAHALAKLFDTYDGSVPIKDGVEIACLRIPASGTASLVIDGRDSQASHAEVYSDAPVEVEVSYPSRGEVGGPRVRCFPAHSVSLPVSIDPGRSVDTRIAVQATMESGTHLSFSVVDSAGADVLGGSNSVDLQPGKGMTILASQLIPSIAKGSFKGTLTLERRWASFAAGRLVVVAVQYDKDALSPVPVALVRP